MDTGFGKTCKIIRKDVIQDTLIGKCGYKSRDIFLFGYGQGGTAAIAADLDMRELGEFGGIISIGGPVPMSSLPAKPPSSTPICVIGGSSNTLITKSALAEIKRCFPRDVSYHKLEGPGDGMPRNTEEMYPIMRFLARRMKSRMGVPEEVKEIVGDEEWMCRATT